MKKSNFKRGISIAVSLFFIFTFLAVLGVGTFFFVHIEKRTIVFDEEQITHSSRIYDRYSNEIEVLGQETSPVAYADIPEVLVDALLSVEDSEFFYHNGFNPKRILTSFVSNLFSNSVQGGSTLTQQLIKNTALSGEKTYSRKVKEAYLSFLLEKEYSKEEILELYFNKIYFEQSVPGIQYACRVFFNKSVGQINLVEAALLAGLVKSPSYYYPFSYPERCTERKNIVLKSMLDNRVIDEAQYRFASAVRVEDILYTKDDPDLSVYPYQAYLDLVYEEVRQLTGKDLYTHPLIVETYLDSSLQKHIDLIQQGSIIGFTDDNQQIGGVVLNNEGTEVIGVIGGRNYAGKKVFNRGFHLKRNPASTIKPVLSYALGMEYLGLHPLSTVKDEAYAYSGTNTEVHNADKKYLGNLSVIEALGYSRNTCAVKIFDALKQKIGIGAIDDYLRKISLMDEGTLSASYALGGMTYGVSPLQMAGAYAMLANHGRYKEPSAVRSIKDADGHLLYQREESSQQVIAEESADQVTYALQKVMEKNYLNINITKPGGIDVAGKTGTNAYDSVTIARNHYPSNADKDIWFAGYSAKNTCVVWTGFDEALDRQNYFTSNDPRKKIAKNVFKSILEQIHKKGEFTYSDQLKKINLVKGLDGDYLPDPTVPAYLIEETLIDPRKTFPRPLPELNIEKIEDVSVFATSEELLFQVQTPLTEDEIYTALYGEKLYRMHVLTPSAQEEEMTSTDGCFTYLCKEKGTYRFDFSVGFRNNAEQKGETYSFSFDCRA